MAILFALLTLVGWGVGDIFVTLAARKLGNIQAYFWGLVFSLVLTCLYLPFAGGISDFGMFLFAAGLNSLVVAGTVLYFKALEEGNASLVGAVGGSFSIPVVVLSLLFFGERISSWQAVGIVLTVIGVILVSLKFQEMLKIRSQAIFLEKAVQYVLLAVVLWGIYYTFIRIPVETIGWFWSYYPANFYFLAFILLGKIEKETIWVVFKNKNTLLPVVAFVILITMAQFSYNLGLLYGYTSIVAPIAGAYPVLFVFLARIIFKEPLTKQQSLGIVSSLLGILLISSPL